MFKFFSPKLIIAKAKLVVSVAYPDEDVSRKIAAIPPQVLRSGKERGELGTKGIKAVGPSPRHEEHR